MEIPFLHLLFEHFIRFRIDEIFHDLLPLLHVQHIDGKELIKVEQVNDLTSIGLDQIGINLMRLLNNTGEEICDEFVHDQVVLLLVRLTWLLVVPEELDRDSKNYLHRFVRLFCVLSADQIDKKLTQNLLKGDDREELALDQHIFGVGLSPDGDLNLLEEVGLFHIVLR